MKFNKPEHKELCLKMIETTNFPGQMLELATEFKQAVQNAEIARTPIADITPGNKPE